MRNISFNLKHIVSRVLLFTSLALVAIPSSAGPLLTPHTAEYKVEISIVNGKLIAHFETTESGYLAESVIKATGLSRMFASGSIRKNRGSRSVTEVFGRFSIDPLTRLRMISRWLIWILTGIHVKSPV